MMLVRSQKQYTLVTLIFQATLMNIFDCLIEILRDFVTQNCRFTFFVNNCIDYSVLFFFFEKIVKKISYRNHNIRLASSIIKVGISKCLHWMYILLYQFFFDIIHLLILNFISGFKYAWRYWHPPNRHNQSILLYWILNSFFFSC